MNIELAPEASRLVSELMESGGYADAQTTLVAALMALRQTHRRMDDFLDSLNNGERPEIEAMVEQGLADVADGRVVPGDVAMQRARDLIERKVRAAG